MISISIIYFLKHASLELLFRNCTESHHPLYSCTALAENIFDNRLAFEVINVVYYRQKYRLFVGLLLMSTKQKSTDGIKSLKSFYGQTSL